MRKFSTEKAVQWIILMVFFLFLLLVFHWSPLAGDDWIYASEVRYSTVLAQTIYAYKTWSGRVLSEFWGFAYTSRKILYDLSGPALMVLTVSAIVRLRRKHTAADLLLVIFLILTMPMFIRTQTMTFPVGFAAYFIPIPLYFLHLLLVKQWLFEDKISLIRIVLMAVFSFVIPLHMENLSVLMAFTNFVIFMYAWVRKLPMKLPLLLLGIAGISCVIMFFSPGTTLRLSAEFSEDTTLDLGRIASNWTPFVSQTMYYADNVNTILNALVICSLLKKGKNTGNYILAGIFVLQILLTWINGLHNLVIDTLWMIVWFAALLYVCYHQEPGDREMMVFLVLGVLVSNGIMVLSPSFPERTTVYAQFCLTALIVLFFSHIEINGKYLLGLCLCLAAGILASGVYWYKIYSLVHEVNIVRQAQIGYYQKRPDAGEAWLLAYPRKSIHSANIDSEEDVDHIRGFHDYFYLAEDLHLNFYYLENYTKDAIRAEMPAQD